MENETQPTIDLSSNDPSALLTLYERIEAGEDVTAKPEGNGDQKGETTTTDDDGKKDADAEAGADAETPAAKSDEGDPNKEPDGVLTKDGKHVIPYTVLTGERGMRAAAEARARAAEAEIEKLKAEIAGKQKPGDEAGELSDDDLKALEEDFPAHGKALRASQEQVKALREKLASLEEFVEAQRAEQVNKTASAVQEAIDSVPKLAHLQVNDPERFERAKELDRVLRVLPSWQGKPMAERFKAVVAELEAAEGEIALPNQPKATETPKPDAKKATGDAAAKAKAAVDAATKRTVVTLSDLPNGEAAATDEREAIEQLTPAQLNAKFSSMSPAQVDAFLAAL